MILYSVTCIEIDFVNRIEFHVLATFSSEAKAWQWMKQQIGSDSDRVRYEIHETELNQE